METINNIICDLRLHDQEELAARIEAAHNLELSRLSEAYERMRRRIPYIVNCKIGGEGQ